MTLSSNGTLFKWILQNPLKRSMWKFLKHRVRQQLSAKMMMATTMPGNVTAYIDQPGSILLRATVIKPFSICVLSWTIDFCSGIWPCQWIGVTGHTPLGKASGGLKQNELPTIHTYRSGTLFLCSAPKSGCLSNVRWEALEDITASHLKALDIMTQSPRNTSSHSASISEIRLKFEFTLLWGE